MTAPSTPTRPEAVTGDARRWLTLAACLVVVGGLSLWLRCRAIGISSLWLDDAWVGVGSHFPTLGDTIRSGLTSPGFSLLYRGWATVFGSGATTAQLLGLGFGLAAPVVLFLAATERGLPWYAALLGSGLLATARAHIDMSVHLKQYTAEAFAMTVVLWVAWRGIDRPASSGRWALFIGAATGASLLSSIGAVAAGSALAFCIVAALIARPRRLRAAVVGTCAYGLVVAPWLLLAVRPNVHDKLADYWRGYYLDGSGFAGGLGTRLGAVARAFQDVPAGIVLLTLAVAAGIVLARRPLVGVLLVLPTLVAVALAALSVVPLGTGRTDVYLFPSYALLVAVAVSELVGMLPARGRAVTATAAVAGFVVVALLASQTVAYLYPEDLTPLVHLAERNRRPGDEIVVYPSAGYAYGIATRYPIEKRPDELAPTDWVVKVRGPDISVLQAHRDDPEKWATPLDRLAGSRRIWLIGSHIRVFRRSRGPLGVARWHPLKDWRALKDMIAARGYEQLRVQHRDGAQLVLFVKKSATVANPGP